MASLRHAFVLAAATMLAAPIARAAPIQMPSGVRWMVAAPSADDFAKKMGPLLDAAAGHAPSLAARRLNNDFFRATGLGLLSADELSARGVDVSRGWTFFERGGSVFLVVGVKNSKVLRGAFEGWAAGRMLKHRDESKLEGGTVVTFARTKGARAAAGYALSGDLALVMLRSAARAAPLADALEAVEKAAPVKPAVSGTVVAYFSRWGAIEDVWLGAAPKADGFDVTGSARRIEPGWIDRGERHAGFLRALVSSPDGSAPADLPLRARIAAGPRLAELLEPALGAALGTPEGERPDWVAKLVQLATAPVELAVTSIDLRNPPPLQGGFDWRVLPELLAMQLVVPDVGTAPASELFAKAGGEGGANGPLRVGSGAGRVTLARDGGALLVGFGGGARPPEAWPAPPGGPALACAKGTPVASVRFDGAAVSRSLSTVGLFAAMRNDVLMGAYGLNAEYGPLLQAGRPLLGLACQEAGGRLSLGARWRFSPAAKRENKTK